MDTILVYNIITWLILIIVFYYQKNKIKAFKSTIDSQAKSLEAIKIFADIFDVNKVKEYVKLNEDRVDAKLEKKVDELNKNFNEKIEKQKQTAETLNKMYVDLVRLVVHLTLHILPKQRNEIFISAKVSTAPNQMLIESLKSVLKEEYIPPKLGVLAYLLEDDLSKKK
jgi:hypothetical protein